MNEDYISIVVPTFREAQNIPVLVERVGASMKLAGLPYEIVIVTEGDMPI